jgi:hypothetical protein
LGSQQPTTCPRTRCRGPFVYLVMESKPRSCLSDAIRNSRPAKPQDELGSDFTGCGARERGWLSPGRGPSHKRESTPRPATSVHSHDTVGLEIQQILAQREGVKCPIFGVSPPQRSCNPLSYSFVTRADKGCAISCYGFGQDMYSSNCMSPPLSALSTA